MFSINNRTISFLILTASILLTPIVSYAEDKAIIVFDASGSMWGQLEGS